LQSLICFYFILEGNSTEANGHGKRKNSRRTSVTFNLNTAEAEAASEGEAGESFPAGGLANIHFQVWIGVGEAVSMLNLATCHQRFERTASIAEEREIWRMGNQARIGWIGFVCRSSYVG
jgi:hypothetical protein